jgi:hypothetical protein
VVTLASGATLRYGRLLSTVPLDVLLRWLGKGEWTEGLVHSSSHIIGIGIRGAWWARAARRHRRLGPRLDGHVWSPAYVTAAPSRGPSPPPHAAPVPDLSPPLPARPASPHGSKCWLYFPEAAAPFYRATVFSNYAAANCPPPAARLRTLCRGDGAPWRGGGASGQQRQQQEEGAAEGAEEGPYWSLMFEVSESSQKPVSQRPVQLGGSEW